MFFDQEISNLQKISISLNAYEILMTRTYGKEL